MDELQRRNELQQLLSEKGLPTNYRVKRDLIERLSSVNKSDIPSCITEADTAQTSNNEEEGEEFDSIFRQSDFRGFTETSQSRNGITAGRTEPDYRPPSADLSPESIGSPLGHATLIEVVKKEIQKEYKSAVMATSSNGFVFKDVEESLEKFSGESGKTVVAWMKEFQEIATVCGWRDVQKYLYCRRLLQGAAKLAVEAADGIASWESLKALLEKEFDQAPTSLDVHRALEKRKKGPNESLLEYLYSMKHLAKRGGVDEKSLVAYIVAGIGDNAINKMVLYEAKSIDELKEKFVVYQEIQRQDGAVGKRDYRSGERAAQSSKESKNHRASGKKCFNCGSTSHLTRVCPNRERGAKCFTCGEFGHMSPSCPKSKGRSSSSGKPSSVALVSSAGMRIKVRIGGENFSALVDTGSDVSLAGKSVHGRIADNLQFKANLGPSIPLAGFGATLKKTLYSFTTSLSVQNNQCTSQLHVVPDEWLPDDVILGKDVLKNFTVVIEDGSVRVLGSTSTEDDFLQHINVVQLLEDDKPHVFEENLSSEFAKEISQLIKDYHPIKPKNSCVEMKISLVDEAPIYHKPRRLAPKERQAVRSQIAEWLEEDIITESNSDFASPVVLANKKDGSYRLCVDYRKLNSKIIKDRYPLPNIEDVIQGLYKAKVFSTIDLRNGFFHVDLTPESRKYTSFITPEGQYEFRKVPFGLCNSPAVFQRFVNTVFRALILQDIIFVYVVGGEVEGGQELPSPKKY